MRLRRQSLRRIFSTCRFTVAGLIPRVEAISRLVIDCETSASTRSSVLVKTAADRRAFTTNLLARTRAAAALAAIESHKLTRRSQKRRAA